MSTPDSLRIMSMSGVSPSNQPLSKSNAKPGSSIPGWLSPFTGKQNETHICILIFLVTACVFFSSLGNGFVQWDDDNTFYLNTHIQGLDIQRLHWMFTDVDYSMRYKPLSWLVYALIFAVNGLNPFGFHLVALLFHCSNGVLVYITLRRLLEIGFQPEKASEQNGSFSLAAAMAALLWSVHPLRVEPVVRATDMTYDQSLFLVLISLWCYLRAFRPREGETTSVKWYLGSIISFGLAMLSYPFACGYPIVLLVLDFYPLRRFTTGLSWNASSRRIWMQKIPFLLLAGIILVTYSGRVNPTGIWAHQEVNHHKDIFKSAAQACYVWTYYLWKPWVPFNLSPVYTTLFNFDPHKWHFLLCIIGVAGLTIILFLKRRAWPLGIALWICHLVLLIPALGLTEIQHYACDRYSYMPSILWSALLAVVFVKLFHPKKSLVLGVPVILLLIGILSAMSIRQVGIWRDTATLYQYVIAKLGNDPLRADLYRKLGFYYTYQGKFGDAANQFKEVVKLEPDHAEMHARLGFALNKEERLDEASDQYRQALNLQPNDAETHKGLGVVLVKKGLMDEAISQFQTALKLQPNDAETHSFIGVTLIKKGLMDEAISQFRTALQLQPDFSGARDNLNAALEMKSRLSQGTK
jgi:Flp pilus assembly protein TadD